MLIFVQSDKAELFCSKESDCFLGNFDKDY